MFEALFGKKQKTFQEEAQLLVEELRWGLNHEQVEVEQERKGRLDARFDKWWSSHGQAALAVAAELELPDLLLDDPVTDPTDEGQRRERELRAIFREVWIREGGRCLFSHVDRDLTIVALPDGPPDLIDESDRPESEELPAIEAPKDKDGKRDKPAVAEAKKRREERRKRRARRRERRRLARGFALVHRGQAGRCAEGQG